MPDLLLLSFATLFLGPLILQLAAQKKSTLHFIDAFVLCSILGIVLFHVIPDCFIHGGALAMAAGGVGVVAPLLLGRVLKHGSCHIHYSLISLASLGLLAHAMLDGMALFGARYEATGAFMLALAVVLHKVPEGVGIWRLISTRIGKTWAFVALGVVALATAAGFYFGEVIVAYATEQTLAVFEGLMAGVLLHVIFHRHGIEDFERRNPVSAGLGAAVGIVLVIGLFAAQPLEHSHATAPQVSDAETQ